MKIRQALGRLLGVSEKRVYVPVHSNQGSHRPSPMPKYKQRANGYLATQISIDAKGVQTQGDGIPSLGFGATSTYNYDVFTALWRMRRLSRDQYQADPYYRRAVRLTQRNVVGAGVLAKPQPRDAAGNVVEPVADAIAAKWRKFGRRGMCDVTRQLSWLDIEYLAVYSMMVDGEFLAVIHTDMDGIRLQVIEPWRLGHEVATDGGRFMGIKVDAYGAPVSYSIAMPVYDKVWGAMSEFSPAQQSDIRDFPAKSVIHLFDREFPEQLRGMPPFTSSIPRLENLADYEATEQQAAAIAAGPLGFITRNEQGGGLSMPTIPAVDEKGKDGQPAVKDGKLEIDTAPGSINELDYAANFAQFDPSHPNTAYQDYVSGVLRGAASGMDLPHVLLSQDTSGVNFSTLRQFALEQRDVWKRWQGLLIEGLHERVWDLWMDLEIVKRGLPQEGVDAGTVADVKFIPRTHEHIQPREQGAANDIALRNKTKSRSQVIREGGRDPMEVDEEIAADAERLKANGMDGADEPDKGGKPFEPNDEADDDKNAKDE